MGWGIWFKRNEGCFGNKNVHWEERFHMIKIHVASWSALSKDFCNCSFYEMVSCWRVFLLLLFRLCLQLRKDAALIVLGTYRFSPNGIL